MTAVIGRLWGSAILLAIGMSWGLSLSLARIAARGGAHPFGITFWQTSITAILLLTVLVAQGEGLTGCARAVRLYAVCGLVGAALPGMPFYYAAFHLPAGTLAICVATIPILTFATSVGFRLERPTLPRILGVICGAASITILVMPEDDSFDWNFAFWILVGCAAAACYAVWNLILALSPNPRASPVTVTCGTYTAAAILMTPVLLVTNSFVPLNWPFGAVEWAIVGMGAIGRYGI